MARAGAYTIDNEFLRDNDSFIEKMSGKSFCWYGLKYEDVTYSVWYNQQSGFVFITKKPLSEYDDVYAITTSDHKPNMLLLQHNHSVFKKLKEMYEYGQIRFDCLQSKTAFYEMINLM